MPQEWCHEEAFEQANQEEQLELEVAGKKLDLRIS
jgi:hypothetical protein